MRNMVRKLVGLPLVVLVLAPGSAALAQAQAPSSTPTETSLGGEGGAVRSDLTFSLTARYGSNVPRIGDEAINRRNLEKQDIRVTPAAQLYVSRNLGRHQVCLLYTSPSPRDQRGSRMPSSA